MRFDAIIVGGGLVGTGLALALHDSGLNIALIEARLPSNQDARLFALNDSSCQFLKNLAIWPKLKEWATPIHDVHVSHYGHFGTVRLKRDDVHTTSLGHVIPARYIEAALNDCLPTLSHVTCFRPARLVTLQQTDQHAILQIETEQGLQTLETSFVIGADGADSTVRTQLNIPTQCVDYQQSAIVTTTHLQRSHAYIAYERFYAQGAIAMLPLPNETCATIWSADNAMITSLMAASDTDFLMQLQDAFGYRLGRLKQIGQRHVFPLRMLRAEKMVQDCVMLIGNAAHSLHPIAAQGYNLALYEVATLVDGLKSQKSLADISEHIQSQQSISIGISHRLATLFANDSNIMQKLLPFCMIGFDRVGPLKKRFIHGTMGKRGRVPRLLLSDHHYEQPPKS